MPKHVVEFRVLEHRSWRRDGFGVTGFGNLLVSVAAYSLSQRRLQRQRLQGRTGVTATPVVVTLAMMPAVQSMLGVRGICSLDCRHASRCDDNEE